MTASGGFAFCYFRAYPIQCECTEMSGSRLISAFGLLAIFLQISAVLSANSVPVVMLNAQKPDSSTPVSALDLTTPTQFAEILRSQVGGSNNPIIVFSRDNLCVEDLSQQQPDLGNTVLSYFPAVVSPLSVLNTFNSYNVSTEDKPDSVANGQLIIVPTFDLNTAIETYKVVKETSPNLLAIITGQSCSYSRSERIRRAVVESRDDNEIVVQADRILFYSISGIYAKIQNAENYILLGQPTAASSVANASDSVRFDLTFTPNNTSELNLRLQFTATASKYWYFESVEYEYESSVATLTSDVSIYTPFNFSYHCTKNAVFYNGSIYLNFTGIQVQIDPTIPSTSNRTAVFSDGYDCIGFTSIPIWSGIFVTAILALIMIWGLTMILDIRTMDRFDDPKGKTITVAAAE